MNTDNRFALLGLSLVALCQAAFAQAASAGDFSAWVITDVHYLASGLYDGGARFERLLRDGDNKNVAMAGPLIDALSWTALSSGADDGKPDCLIVTGDLTLNGERASHLELASRLKALEAAGVQVFVIPGNHDTDNPMASKFAGNEATPVDTVNPGMFEAIYRQYGFAGALSRDADSLSYLAEPKPGVMLLMIDSTRTEANMDQGYSDAGGSISYETRAWIAGCAKRATLEGARLIVAMHHNLMDHNAVINCGYTVDDGEGLASLFSGVGIRYILTGHTHIQDIARTCLPGGPIDDITTGALSVFPHNYGVLSLPGGGTPADVVYYSRRVDVAAWARASGSQNKALLDFDKLAAAYFNEHSETMMASLLDSDCEAVAAESGIVRFAATQSEQLISILVTVNARFFSGTEDMNKADLADPACPHLLEKLPSGFLSEYAHSIVDDQFPADNSWSL